jgi:trigger factor
MKSSLEKTSALGRKLNITVPAEMVSQTFDRILKNVQKQATIKGFRQGKAPLQTIKTIYGDRVQQDVVQELVQKHYVEAIRSEKIDPISYPEFEFDAPMESKDFNFSASFDVKPEINLNKYEALEVEKEKYEFDSKKIEQVLENIRAAKASLVDILENRPAQMGDIAVIDFAGTISGQPLEGGTGTDHHLELGSKQFIEGFEEGIVGMSIGGNTTLNLKFPTPYHSKDLEGKDVQFQVTLKGIKKKSLPELNDEFVAQMMGSTGETKTLAALKETIQKDIEQSEQKRIDGDFKNRLLKKLVELNPVDVPASMLQDQKQALVDDMKKKMLDQGLSDDQFIEYAKKWDGDFTKTASEMIQSGFLIDAIAKKHDLLATEEDVEQKYLEYAKQTGIDLERIKEFYSRPEQESRISYMITEEKVISFLLKSAKVTEVAATKLKESQN